jgi:alcohol dehydrogenase class IV
MPFWRKSRAAKRALIVTDKGVVKHGMVAPIEESLHAGWGSRRRSSTTCSATRLQKNVHHGVAPSRAPTLT